MDNDAFVQYLNSQDVHDGQINKLVEETNRVLVFVDTIDERLVVFEFTGVREVRKNRPEGMFLYSLTEFSEAAPFRRFAFMNWDEEDDAYLDVIAMELSSHER